MSSRALGANKCSAAKSSLTEHWYPHQQPAATIQERSAWRVRALPWGERASASGSGCEAWNSVGKQDVASAFACIAPEPRVCTLALALWTATPNIVSATSGLGKTRTSLYRNCDEYVGLIRSHANGCVACVRPGNGPSQLKCLVRAAVGLLPALPVQRHFPARSSDTEALQV